MGTCYTYLLYDDFDWRKDDFSSGRQETIEKIKRELPRYATVEAHWPHWIVVDLDKNSPWGERVQKLKKYCDAAYYYPDTGGYELKKVEFKKTEEEIRQEANEPQNRNKTEIDRAYRDWLQRYQERNSNI